MIPLSVCIIGKNEEENIDVILYEIERKIQELKWNKPQIKVCNGEWYIETSIFSNRKTEKAIELLEFLKCVYTKYILMVFS